GALRAPGLRRRRGGRRPGAGGRDARGPHGATATPAARPPLRLDLRRTDRRAGRLRHPGGSEDRARPPRWAVGPARGGLLLRAGGLGPAALPEGVVRRGRSDAGETAGAAGGGGGPGPWGEQRGRRRRVPRPSGLRWGGPRRRRRGRCWW